VRILRWDDPRLAVEDRAADARVQFLETGNRAILGETISIQPQIHLRSISNASDDTQIGILTAKSTIDFTLNIVNDN
jgi:hypothetical protein